MIDIIYIPTFNRVGKQKTYDSLPDKWKEKTYLVVSPDEIHSGYQTISCPIQGKGIAPVRKWIAEHGEGKRYSVLDDDIEFVYTRRENEDGPSNNPLTDQQFCDMFDTMNNWIDEGYIHVACDVCGKVTERREHCDQTTERISGLAWMNNAWVNVLGIAGGVGFIFLFIG